MSGLVKRSALHVTPPSKLILPVEFNTDYEVAMSHNGKIDFINNESANMSASESGDYDDSPNESSDTNDTPPGRDAAPREIVDSDEKKKKAEEEEKERKRSEKKKKERKKEKNRKRKAKKKRREKNEDMNRKRLQCGIVFTEVVCVAAILATYSIIAVHNTNIMERLDKAIDGICCEDLYSIIWACIFWIALYVAGIVMLAFTRFGEDNVYGDLMAAGADILYHLVRWPVFAITILGSFEGRENDYNSDAMINFAFWQDTIVVCVCAMIGGAAFVTWYICCQ